MSEELKAVIRESINITKDTNYMVFANKVISNGNIDFQNNEGMTLLMYAINLKDTELIKYLIDNGANPNLKNNAGNTALMYAIVLEDLEAIRALVEKGADIRIKNNENISPLEYGFMLNNDLILNALLGEPSRKR